MAQAPVTMLQPVSLASDIWPLLAHLFIDKYCTLAGLSNLSDDDRPVENSALLQRVWINNKSPGCSPSKFL